jgi:hypothetical protein
MVMYSKKGSEFNQSHFEMRWPRDLMPCLERRCMYLYVWLNCLVSSSSGQTCRIPAVDISLSE